MAGNPDTRITLLHRIRDHGDTASWAEFVEVYTPLLYAYCKKRDIRAQDTADITQDVFRSIARAIGGFEYDREKGLFRGWLFTVLRNAVSSHFRKANRAPLTPGETAFLLRLDAEGSAEDSDWNRDYEVRLLRWAMGKVRPEFSERTWEIFSAISLEDKTPAEVAERFGMRPNAVAVTKYRVVRRLRQKMHSIDAERWEQDVIAAEKSASFPRAGRVMGSV